LESVKGLKNGTEKGKIKENKRKNVIRRKQGRKVREKINKYNTCDVKQGKI
jgi:hypothetical protein